MGETLNLLMKLLGPSGWGMAVDGLLLAVGLFLLGNAALALLLRRLPADYFCSSHAVARRALRHPLLHWAILIGKNLLGLLLVLLGIFLAMPGVPGPGLLVILIGSTLVDFPGKRHLERKILTRPRVLQTLNSLRSRLGVPPLLVDAPCGDAVPE